MADPVFSVHPSNPRCFQYHGKPLKLLASAEHYGAVLNADFAYDVYLHEMRRTGQNATRVFTFYRETPHCIPGPGGAHSLAPTPQAAVLPWERVSGHGAAADGREKFDLNRWNPAYFARLKNYVSSCADHGVICEIVLFCNPYNQEKYDLFPCSSVSNVNGVGGHIEAPQEFMTLKDPTIVAFQEAFVRQMAIELNGFDNVYYEICNEPGLRSGSPAENEQKIVAWHAHLARVLRRVEEALPKRHLIAANAHFRVPVPAGPEEADVPLPPDTRHDDGSYFANPDIDIINYHYLSAKADAEGLRFRGLRSDEAQAGLIGRFLRQRDSYRKPMVFDETYSGIVRGAPERYAINRAEAWETLLSGGAGYNNLDWSFTPDDETGAGQAPIGDGRRLDGRCLREWLDLFRQLLDRYDLASLVPAAGVLPPSIPGYGAAAATDDSGGYLLYFVDERLYRSEPCEARELAVSLRLPSGRYLARTFDPQTGATAALPALSSEGLVSVNIPPFREDVAVLLER